MKLASHTASAAAFIFRGKRLLLIHNPRKGWETPGGIIEEGETVIEALKREVKEECNLNVKVKRLSSVPSIVNSQQGYNGVDMILPLIVFDFVCECDENDIVLSQEHDDFCWVELDEAEKVMKKDLIYRFRSSLKKPVDFFGGIKKKETVVFEEIEIGD